MCAEGSNYLIPVEFVSLFTYKLSEGNNCCSHFLDIEQIK